MQIQLTPESPEEALVVRALDARALEAGGTVADLLAPWINDQAGAAVNRQRLSEESVSAAEARTQAAAQARAEMQSAEAQTGPLVYF
jgi:hypothetical protein